jgi:hypothetical protein
VRDSKLLIYHFDNGILSKKLWNFPAHLWYKLRH